MALTTVVQGRAYDWSHAIGRGAATGTGFNYIQTMCLGNDGDIYIANRGNENNFGMRVNRIQLGGPGRGGTAIRVLHGTAKATARPSGRSASRWARRPRLLLGRVDQHHLGVRSGRQVQSQVRQDRQRRRRTAPSGGTGCREATATSSSSTAATTGFRCSPRKASWSRSAARPASATASSTSRGASRSTRTATSTSPTGRTIVSRSCRRRASS